MNTINEMTTKSSCNLADLFPFTSKELIFVLESLLEFNPYFRPRVKDLLKNKIFDSARVPQIEEGS